MVVGCVARRSSLADPPRLADAGRRALSPLTGRSAGLAPAASPRCLARKSGRGAPDLRAPARRGRRGRTPAAVANSGNFQSGGGGELLKLGRARRERARPEFVSGGTFAPLEGGFPMGLPGATSSDGRDRLPAPEAACRGAPRAVGRSSSSPEVGRTSAPTSWPCSAAGRRQPSRPTAVDSGGASRPHQPTAAVWVTTTDALPARQPLTPATGPPDQFPPTKPRRPAFPRSWVSPSLPRFGLDAG